MCAPGSSRVRRRRPRPRWGALAAGLLAALLALGGVERLGPAGPPGTALELALVALAFVGARRWLRANAVALDLASWCACAPATLHVRVVAGATAPSAGPRDGDEARRSREPAHAARRPKAQDRRRRFRAIQP